MDENIMKRVPRMRTVSKTVEAIRAMDPDTDITEYCIRKLARDGKIPVTWAGNKALINLDDVLDLFRLGTEREEPTPEVVDGIRRVNVR